MYVYNISPPSTIQKLKTRNAGQCKDTFRKEYFFAFKIMTFKMREQKHKILPWSIQFHEITVLHSKLLDITKSEE